MDNGTMAADKSWVEQTADLVEQRVVETRGRNAKITCASGISPSGPVHLGNLREIITVHLVTEELKLRGWNAEHIHSWDDFDRLRKVPANVPESFAEHIGQPLADVPDPFGEFPSYAERFKQEFESAMHELGIAPRFISQAAAYRRGDYVAQIKTAIDHRFEIFDILAEYQTLDRFEKTADERREEYYPARVYCETCDKDDTVITAYEPATATIHYTCASCGYAGQFSLDEKCPCKLVWKVDWPMRWSYEQVDFEPAGEDHAAPGSSYTVGQKIVRDIYHFLPPVFIGYAFVGMAGRSKMSSSVGTSATPRAALDILEPAIIRWLYLRRNPGQKFNIDFGQEVIRLYDEWDTFAARQATASPTDQKVFEMSVRTSAGPIRRPALPVSFRLLASAADITAGNREQILRIAADALHLPPGQPGLEEQIEPRLSCAARWATQYLPEDERTFIRPAFDAETYQSLDELVKAGLRLLLDRLDENWSLEGLTTLVYAVPKLQLGLPLDAKPTDELKQAQRRFFIAIYRLICNSDTGPRLPTLFLSIGEAKVRELLGGG
jgi:lysyl-tRNA synthetase, class I